MAKTIQENIDELFGDSNSKAEDLSAFVDSLRASQTEADKKFRRSLWFLLIAWALFYLTSEGVVSEGQILPFKVSRIIDLAIAAPVVLGGLAYMLLGEFATMIYLKVALNQCYVHLLPKAAKNSLFWLLLTASFYTIENIFLKESGIRALHVLDTVWTFSMMVLFLFLPVAAVIHGALMLLSTTHFAWYWDVSSISLGSLLLIRGWLLIVSCSYSIERKGQNRQPKKSLKRDAAKDRRTS